MRRRMNTGFPRHLMVTVEPSAILLRSTSTDASANTSFVAYCCNASSSLQLLLQVAPCKRPKRKPHAYVRTHTSSLVWRARRLVLDCAEGLRCESRGWVEAVRTREGRALTHRHGHEELEHGDADGRRVDEASARQHEVRERLLGRITHRVAVVRPVVVPVRIPIPSRLCQPENPAHGGGYYSSPGPSPKRRAAAARSVRRSKGVAPGAYTMSAVGVTSASLVGEDMWESVVAMLEYAVGWQPPHTTKGRLSTVPHQGDRAETTCWL